MHKLILAVFLTVVQAPVPIPRQTTDGPTSTSNNNQNQTKNKNKPAISLPAVGHDQTEAAKTNPAEDGRDNAEHPVIIGKLPPVTVTPIRRDWFDKAYWGFTGLLALTGLLQILVLIKTYKVASKQADISQRQETQMIEAGKQTERIITQMKETEVRNLRAYVGVSKVQLDFQNPLQPIGKVEIRNFGKTPAYKVYHWVGITMGRHPATSPLPPYPEQSRSSVSDKFPGIRSFIPAKLGKAAPVGTIIGTQEHTIYIYGKVVYEDVFKNEWYTEYRFIFGGEGGGMYQRLKNGKLLGAMCPDSEGNHAT